MAPDIAIIGAGLAGVCMATRLKAAGIDSFTVFEKADEVGGVWRDNSYPGAACDLVSHLYSYSFATRGWRHSYGHQAEILDYVKDCATDFDIRPHIEFTTEITGAHFDAAARRWRLRTATGEEHLARILIPAVGQLGVPRTPDISGQDTFTGTSFHTARWAHGHDLGGRSVAVIGNGCSAVQVVPAIAPRVRRLTVFARSPKWIIPKRNRAVPPWLHRRPWLTKVNRAIWFLMAETLIFSAIQGGLGGSVMTAAARRHLRRQVRDPGLRAALMPDYAFGCNRMILSDDYYPALARDNVELVTDPIAAVTPTGIRTVDGRHHDVDTIIYATGFRSTRFLGSLDVTGPGGSLRARWHDGASAHLGITVPGFPNMFLLYGPNTSSGHNSVIHMLESQVGYVLRCVGLIGADGVLAVTEAAFEEYTRDLVRRLDDTVWTGDCRSWYKTETGRVTALWPRRAISYRRATRRPNPAHFQHDV